MKLWTFLIYAGADSRLRQPIFKKLDQLEELAGGPIAMIAQLDQPGEPGARRLELRPDGIPDRVTSPSRARLGPIDMASPRALASFLDWGMRAYPARHYALLVLGDGDVLTDRSGRHRMSGTELGAALLQAGRPVDVLALDSDGSGLLEVAQAVREGASYLIGREIPSGPAGLPWASLLPGAGGTPEALCRGIVERADRLGTLPLVTATRLSGLPVMPPLEWLAQEGALAVGDAQDVADMARRTERDPQADPRVRALAERLRARLDGCQLARSGPALPGAHGFRTCLGARIKGRA